MTTEEFLEQPPFPSYIQFETGTACNAHCLMCPHDKMRRAGRATWTMLGKIIQEAIPKVQECSPFLMQEPFLEPRLVNILCNIRSRNPKCRTTIYSNMNAITQEQIHTIIDYDLLNQLHISFYGPTPELYKKWQPPLDWHRTLENIKAFHDYREQKHKKLPHITHNIIGIAELFINQDKYAELTMPYVDEIRIVQYDTFHGDVPDYGGSQVQYWGRPPDVRTPCQRLWSGLTVHFNGDVVPCCIDYQAEHVLGNIHENTLAEIWAGNKYQKFRALHASGNWNQIPMCKHCVVPDYQFHPDWVKYWVTKQVSAKS